MAESTLLSRNCDLAYPARTIGATTIPDLLRSNGYVIFDRLLTDDTVELCEELEPSLAATKSDQGGLSGHITRIRSVLQKSPSSRAVATHPIMLCVANAILGANFELFHLCLTQGVRVYPGQWQREPHRDSDNFHSNSLGIEYLINVMWSLSDFTANNGAPILWPRSHFSRSLPDLNSVKSVVATMPRGSALVYLGSLMYCGGANRSREPLTGLHFRYCLGSLNQYVTPSDSYPADVMRRFPETLRELLGLYNLGPDLCGLEDDGFLGLSDTDPHTEPPLNTVPTAIPRDPDISRADELMGPAK